MMVLGCCDSDISQSALDAYEKLVEGISRVPMAEVKDGSDKLTFKKHTPDDKQPMTVRQVQQALGAAAFFRRRGRCRLWLHTLAARAGASTLNMVGGCQVINGRCTSTITTCSSIVPDSAGNAEWRTGRDPGASRSPRPGDRALRRSGAPVSHVADGTLDLDPNSAGWRARRV